jgi:hypothetical protein
MTEMRAIVQIAPSTLALAIRGLFKAQHCSRHDIAQGTTLSVIEIDHAFNVDLEGCRCHRGRLSVESFAIQGHALAPSPVGNRVGPRLRAGSMSVPLLAARHERMSVL